MVLAEDCISLLSHWFDKEVSMARSGADLPRELRDVGKWRSFVIWMWTLNIYFKSLAQSTFQTIDTALKKNWRKNIYTVLTPETAIVSILVTRSYSNILAGWLLLSDLFSPILFPTNLILLVIFWGWIQLK